MRLSFCKHSVNIRNDYMVTKKCNNFVIFFFFWYSAVNSRSMTPITWQAAVDDEEQRPLLQDILEAAVDDRQQAAVDVEEQRPQLQAIFEAAIDGNHV